MSASLELASSSRPPACVLLAGVLFYKNMFKNKYLRYAGSAPLQAAA
jgi:hypothetical protein